MQIGKSPNPFPNFQTFDHFFNIIWEKFSISSAPELLAEHDTQLDAVLPKAHKTEREVYVSLLRLSYLCDFSSRIAMMKSLYCTNSLFSSALNVVANRH